jgi:hypothetical protein
VKRPVPDLLSALGLPATAPPPPKPRGRPGPVSASGRAKKGGRVEREIVALIRSLGIECWKVPASGALAARLGDDFAGDIKALIFGPDTSPATLEVKSRAGGAGFAVIEGWLGSCDALILKRNNAPPLVTLPWSTWARIIARRG